jgi:hypothetical protein
MEMEVLKKKKKIAKAAEGLGSSSDEDESEAEILKTDRIWIPTLDEPWVIYQLFGPDSIPNEIMYMLSKQAIAWKLIISFDIKARMHTTYADMIPVWDRGHPRLKKISTIIEPVGVAYEEMTGDNGVEELMYIV